MRTVFIADLSLGMPALASLQEALAAWPVPEALVLARPGEVEPTQLPATVSLLDASPAAAEVQRVILAGPFEALDRFEAGVDLLAAVQRRGGSGVLHAVSLPRQAAILAPDAARRAALLAATLSARDYRTAEILAGWQPLTMPQSLRYPEAQLPGDARLLRHLRVTGPLLGIAFSASAPRRAAWTAAKDRIAALLEPYAGAALVPLVMAPSAPGQPSPEVAGFRTFAKQFLPEAAIALPQMLDANWWRNQVTPRRLKGLIAGCGAVVTEHELIGAYAAECGTPVLGVIRAADEAGLLRALSTLGGRLAPATRLEILPD